MNEFLTGSTFRYLLFPLASAGLGVYVKYVTRNDQFAKFRKEDLAVGLDLLRIASLIYLLLTSDRAIALARLSAMPLQTMGADADALRIQAAELSDSISMAGWGVALFIIALWSVSTIVRKFGWESESELKPVMGIAVPLVFGVTSLILVMLGETP